MIEVFFDVETKKLFSEINTNNPGDLGVSIVSVYKRELDSNQKEIHREQFFNMRDGSKGLKG